MSSAAQDRSQPLQADPVVRHDIGVLIADDNQAFRGTLRDLIRATSGFVLVGEACSGEEAIGAVEALAPDLVLMDVVMPGIGGIAAANTIVSRRPDVRVVLISVNDPALSDGASTLARAVVCARKQDLRPTQLRHFWQSPRAFSS
jgi:CheY-like chemotaxis protein